MSFQLWVQIFGAVLMGVFLYSLSVGELSRRIRSRKAMDQVLAAYKAGDYGRALAAAEGLKDNGKETEHYCFFYGIMLQHLSRPQESESWLSRAVGLCRRTDKRALLRGALGETLIQLGRFEDARTCFEEGIQEAPRYGCLDRGVAETWLRESRRLDEGLSRASRAVEKDQASGLPAPVYHMTSAKTWRRSPGRWPPIGGIPPRWTAWPKKPRRCSRPGSPWHRRPR